MPRAPPSSTCSRARWWRESLAEVLPALLVDESQAAEAARMILRENARVVYRLV